jgi:hypothetical protein
MPTVLKTAAELTAGDSIDFSGVEFVLVEISSHYGDFISLDFNTDEGPRECSDMYLDCKTTTLFNVIIK